MFTLSKKDFALCAANFDLAQTPNVLRIMVGALMFPHAAGKFTDGALNAGTVAFFAKAGLQPAELMVGLAASSEIAVGIALVLGICTRFAGLGAAAILAIASYAVVSLKGLGWAWNTGGIEYNVVWAVLGLLVAIDAWKETLNPRRPVSMSRFEPAHA
jgi:putative oxidoreductase